MVEKPSRRYCILILLLSISFIVSFRPRVGRAADEGDPPERKAPVVVAYTRYQWWLIRWVDNQVLCSIFTDQEGLPTGDDIFADCGRTIYNIWAATPACTSNAEQCAGVYLHLVSKEPAEKTVLVDLPPAQVFLSLENCPYPTSSNLCDRLPSLVFTGQEPIPDEEIIAIRGFINGEPFSCTGSECEIPLRPTRMEGVFVDFWADSSFGDSSSVFQAKVRVVESGVSADPASRGWYVDVLSSQWNGKPAPICAQIWNTFPPIGEAPSWLDTPPVPEFLATQNPYYYLAGRLIAQGMVNAGTCPAGGLLPNGYANECGLEIALPEVNLWQNQFDPQILEIANQVNIPAHLLKNLFAQESQFWPGAFKDPKEFGLGQLTDSGAETILLWDTRFFHQFCPTMLEASTCQRGYVYLSKENQQILRGALAIQVRADCADCTAGINLENVKSSINLFAYTLVANCAQVSRLIYNATNRTPEQVQVRYEDLWRFTAANYHVGPGCLSYAVYSAWARGEPLEWERVSAFLTSVCLGVIEYIDNVTQ